MPPSSQGRVTQGWMGGQLGTGSLSFPRGHGVEGQGPSTPRRGAGGWAGGEGEEPGLAAPLSWLQVMKVKLQPPSGTELPAFNPIVHPSAITQVLLLANPQKVRAQLCRGPAAGGGSPLSAADSLTSPFLPQEKVRLRYKLLFTMGDQTYNEMGDVDQFPPPETWGSL